MISFCSIHATVSDVCHTTNLLLFLCWFQDNGGWTPIIWAAEHKHVEVIKALLNRGADVSVKDKVGRPALIWSRLAK